MIDIEAILPRDIAALRTEANLSVVWPWFEKSLALRGDILEVGCFHGTMSIKFAFVVAARRQQKTVFAFDTFEGFLEDDEAPGGARVKGDYNAGPDAYDNLLRWGDVLPIIPIRGNVETALPNWIRGRDGHLSFVWLDLDIAYLMDTTLMALSLSPLLSFYTIIGVDDYGRPDCPSVKPWADGLEASGKLVKLGEGPPGTYIAFYQHR